MSRGGDEDLADLLDDDLEDAPSKQKKRKMAALVRDLVPS